MIADEHDDLVESHLLTIMRALSHALTLLRVSTTSLNSCRSCLRCSYLPIC